MDPVTDEMILQALRKRLLEEAGGQRGQGTIVNNVYGGSPFNQQGGAQKGVLEGLMSEGEEGQDPFEYFVDIARRDVTEGGEKVGWDKTVRRYRKKKDTDDFAGPGTKKKAPMTPGL